MPTRYDHIKLEAGLISKLPGRSDIMNSTFKFTYSGNLQGLIETLEAHFKDPNVLTLEVIGAFNISRTSPDMDRLLDRLALDLTSSRAVLIQGRPEYPRGIDDVIDLVRVGQKIGAIKALRTITNCGLKEGKDAVEGPLAQYIERLPH